MGKPVTEPHLPFPKQPGPHPLARFMKPNLPLYSRYNSFTHGWNDGIRGTIDPPPYFINDNFCAAYELGKIQAISGRREPDLTEVMIKLTGDQRAAVIHAALHHIEKEWVIRESRRLHKNGATQADAIKRAMGTSGGPGGSFPLYWQTCPKGLQVTDSDLIPWRDLIPHVWPPAPRKPIQGKVKPTAWSSL